MNAREPTAASPLETAFARYCAEQNMVEDSTAPHGEAFTAGFMACSAAVLAICTKPKPDEGPSLRKIRYLLNELHYVGDGGGVVEDDLAGEIEGAFRWLLDQYLRRGTHTTNDPAVTE